MTKKNNLLKRNNTNQIIMTVNFETDQYKF